MEERNLSSIINFKKEEIYILIHFSHLKFKFSFS